MRRQLSSALFCKDNRSEYERVLFLFHARKGNSMRVKNGKMRVRARHSMSLQS